MQFKELIFLSQRKYRVKITNLLRNYNKKELKNKDFVIVIIEDESSDYNLKLEIQFLTDYKMNNTEQIIYDKVKIWVNDEIKMSKEVLINYLVSILEETRRERFKYIK